MKGKMDSEPDRLWMKLSKEPELQRMLLQWGLACACEPQARHAAQLEIQHSEVGMYSVVQAK